MEAVGDTDMMIMTEGYDGGILWKDLGSGDRGRKENGCIVQPSSRARVAVAAGWQRGKNGVIHGRVYKARKCLRAACAADVFLTSNAVQCDPTRLAPRLGS
jgi:hypothetical protein